MAALSASPRPPRISLYVLRRPQNTPSMMGSPVLCEPVTEPNDGLCRILLIVATVPPSARAATFGKWSRPRLGTQA